MKSQGGLVDYCGGILAPNKCRAAWRDGGDSTVSPWIQNGNASINHIYIYIEYKLSKIASSNTPSTLSLSLSLCGRLSNCLSICLSIYLYTYLPTCLPACLPTYLPMFTHVDIDRYTVHVCSLFGLGTAFNTTTSITRKRSFDKTYKQLLGIQICIKYGCMKSVRMNNVCVYTYIYIYNIYTHE